MGADAIELDVHLSIDRVPVVIHDFSVDRTTDGTGLVSSLTLAELKRLDAGSSFGAAFAGERIPTLTEVLEALGERLLVNIELKSTGLRATGLASAVVALVGACGLGDRCLISSFNPVLLRRAKRLAPDIVAGLLYAPGLPLPLRRAWAAPFVKHEARHPEHTMVDARYMAWARRRGYQVNTWTVDEPEEMRRLIGLGVDGIITNLPDVLRDQIGASSGPGRVAR
jgi:glycerophosphoryl diester phosphodiesterase